MTPKRVAAAELFVHDVVRRKLPGEVTTSVQESGPLQVLPCTPSKALATGPAWSWFAERISLLGPLADAVLCIELDAGFMTVGRLGTIEGRFPLFAMNTAVFLQQALGVGMEELFELHTSPELVAAYSASAATSRCRTRRSVWPSGRRCRASASRSGRPRCESSRAVRRRRSLTSSGAC